MDKKKKVRKFVGDIPDMVPGVSLAKTIREMLPEESGLGDVCNDIAIGETFEKGRNYFIQEQNDTLVHMASYPVLSGFVSGESIKEPMKILAPIDIKLSPEMELFLKRLKEIQDEFLHALSYTKPYNSKIDEQIRDSKTDVRPMGGHRRRV